MKKILFVEDDALIAKIYGQKLTQEGFEVTLAMDGLAAMKQLSETRPDLVVLDILMPKLNGVDVLRFIRQHPDFKSTRVIVFSNAFLNDTGDQLAALGVDEMLLKAAATPKQVIETIHRIVNLEDRTMAPVVQPETPTAPAVVTAPVVPQTNAPGPESSKREGPAEFGERIRRDFFEQIPVITKSVQLACGQFLEAVDPADRTRKLEALNRKMGFITHMTGMAGCYRISQLTSVFEALLFELQEKPSSLNDSSRQTIAATVDLLLDSLGRADSADEQYLSPTTLLVVDDDVVSNRALMLALNRFRLAPLFLVDPYTALENLRNVTYDLVLLDINLPGMDGIQLCEQMRSLPLHENTPVVFMTSHPEFLPRAQAILRGGDDLIAKPILPVELTTKVIAHSLKRRVARQTGA
jgi:CheY-like chemotaxis protein